MTNIVYATTPESFAASYERQSKMDAEGIESQFRSNSEYAATLGLVLLNTPEFRFSDVETSGRTTVRTGYQRLKDAVDAPGGPSFQHVIIRHLDRWNRWPDPLEAFAERLWFQKRGVTLHFSDDPYPRQAAGTGDDPLADAKFLIDCVRQLGASREISTFVRRVHLKRRDLALQGYCVSGVSPYATERWLVDAKSGAFMVPSNKYGTVHAKTEHHRLRWKTDGTKEIVSRIFSWVLLGWSLRRIAKHLNSEHVPPPAAFEWRKVPASPRNWTENAVGRIVAHPIYGGTTTFGIGRGANAQRVHRELMRSDSPPSATQGGTEPIVIHGGMADPPVSRTLWIAANDLVQARGAEVKGRRRRANYALLAGHLRCARCLRGYTVSYTRYRGREYRYYKHPPTPTGYTRCPQASINAHVEDVDAEITAATHRLLQLPGVATALTRELRTELMARSHGSRRPEIESIEQRLRELGRQVRVTLDATTGLVRSIVADEARRILEVFQAEGTQLEARRRELLGEENVWSQALEHLEQMQSSGDGLVLLFERAPMELKQSLLKLLTDPVQLDGDTQTIDIRFRVSRLEAATQLLSHSDDLAPQEPPS